MRDDLAVIEYELHDSVIVGIAIGPRREVEFIIDLYPIVYPSRPRVRLRFGGIENFEAVQRYVNQIQAEGNAGYLGCRIDCFQYDTKAESQANDYWFLLETDWCGPVRIHCSKMSMTELQQPSENVRPKGRP